MRIVSSLLLVLFLSTPARAQQSFYSHDNYTQYELLEPGSAQFAITYFVTERRAGAVFLLNQTRSGSAGSDISVFDPRTGKPLKFDYLSGEELTRDSTPGRFDPAEHYVRAKLAAPVPEGGEGRVKILKTYTDEKSYYVEGEDIVFRRSFGIARNAIMLPKGYQLSSSNVAAQIFTLPDGRVKISFEHAHGYAADVTVRGRKSDVARRAAAVDERSFDFSKSLFDLGAPEAHAFKVIHELLTGATNARGEVQLPVAATPAISDLSVVDVDSGAKLPFRRERGSLVITLPAPITERDQSARLRIIGTITEPAFRLVDGLLEWECTIQEPRATVLLPAGWELASVSVPATFATQQDGRAVIQIYNGRSEAMKVTIRAVKR
jgi:hypothetical protein